MTPHPQAGNPRPRVFRLADDRAIVNRLGFNSEGHAAVMRRLQEHATGGVVGVNLGANRESKDMGADYVVGLRAFAGLADYVVVNISSPNTPGLRDLQEPQALDALLNRLMHARHDVISAGHPRRPILVKLAPDIADEDLEEVVGSLTRHGIDGIIVSNTTIARPKLADVEHAKEAGGLSGAPLFLPSTRMLARVYRMTEGAVPLIGVGGIDSGARAVDKVRAGASLLQLYTGLVYEGPELLHEIKAALIAELDRTGAGSISDLVGTEAREWAERTLD